MIQGGLKCGDVDLTKASKPRVAGIRRRDERKRLHIRPLPVCRFFLGRHRREELDPDQQLNQWI